MSIEEPIPRARRVVVAIPALNEARHIVQVVEALLKDVSPALDVRVVVADGGSTDGTVELAQRIARERSGVEYMHNPARIQSAAVNAVARRYRQHADVLVRCDAHSTYPSGFIVRVLQTLDRTGADAVVVPMDSSGVTCVERAVAWVCDTPVGSGGSAHRGGKRSGYVDHGHHAAFRMDSFVRAGGYDESFTHNEDAELDCRQRALGGRIYLDADIRIGYSPRGTLSGLWRQYFGYGRGRSRTVRRHPGSMRLRQLAVPVYVASCITALLLSPWWPMLLLWPGIYVAGLAAISVQLAVQRRSLCGLLAGAAAATMHWSWALGFFKGLATTREEPWSPGMHIGAFASATEGRDG